MQRPRQELDLPYCLELAKLYKYIFVAAKPILSDKMPETARNKRIDTFSAETKAYFFGNTEDPVEIKEERKAPPVARSNLPKKTAILIAENDREIFRCALRKLNSSDLEIILFGNNIDTLKVKNVYGEAREYDFPDDKKIDEKFNHLESQYGFFDEKEIPEEKENFLKCFKVAKIVGDFIEYNNNQEDDELAAERAYAMTVIFSQGKGPKRDVLSAVDAYLNEFIYHTREKDEEDDENDVSPTRQPLHDALLPALPNDNAGPIKNKIDLLGWRALIKKQGKKAFHLFNNAAAIDEVIKQMDNEKAAPEVKARGAELKPAVPSGLRAPTSLDEALLAETKVYFSNSASNSPLALLFRKTGRTQAAFDKALQILELRKQIEEKEGKPYDNNLPNILIKGKKYGEDPSAIDATGYYLVKLPAADWNGFVLGELTQCCQSLGENSEECVIDGMTRRNNGFYVLLKASKPTTAEPFIEGKINYSNYKIIGQGYAWRSQHNNITFDSWENLTPSKDDAIILPMLEELSQKMVADEKENIFRTTIGRGGKTPKEFLDAPYAFPETMLEGFNYGDAKHQAKLYENDTLRNELTTELKNAFSRSLIVPNEVKSAEYNESFLLDWLLEPCISKKCFTDRIVLMPKLSPFLIQQYSFIKNNEQLFSEKDPLPIISLFLEYNLLNESEKFYSKCFHNLTTAPFAVKYLSLLKESKLEEHDSIMDELFKQGDDSIKKNNIEHIIKFSELKLTPRATEMIFNWITSDNPETSQINEAVNSLKRLKEPLLSNPQYNSILFTVITEPHKVDLANEIVRLINEDITEPQIVRSVLNGELDVAKAISNHRLYISAQLPALVSAYSNKYDRYYDIYNITMRFQESAPILIQHFNWLINKALENRSFCTKIEMFMSTVRHYSKETDDQIIDNIKNLEEAKLEYTSALDPLAISSDLIENIVAIRDATYDYKEMIEKIVFLTNDRSYVSKKELIAFLEMLKDRRVDVNSMSNESFANKLSNFNYDKHQTVKRELKVNEVLDNFPLCELAYDYPDKTYEIMKAVRTSSYSDSFHASLYPPRKFDATEVRAQFILQEIGTRYKYDSHFLNAKFTANTGSAIAFITSPLLKDSFQQLYNSYYRGSDIFAQICSKFPESKELKEACNERGSNRFSYR